MTGPTGWLGLNEAAPAATRTKDLAADTNDSDTRKPSAVEHSIICACWHMLSAGELYNDLGSDYFQRRDPERITKRLIAQLEALGQPVTPGVTA